MSKIRLSMVDSTGTYLNGCMQSQKRFVQITVDDENRKTQFQVAMSLDQLSRMLVSNMEVECTLMRYPAFEEGKVVLMSEKVEKPESVKSRMRRRMGEVRISYIERAKELKLRIADIVAGRERATKTAMREILQEMEVLENHYEANENYVVTRLEEEADHVLQNTASQLALMFKGVEDGIMALGAEKKPLIEEKNEEPKSVAETHGHVLEAPPKREQLKVEDMTMQEIAREVTDLLRRLPDKENSLFSPSAVSRIDGIGVTYVNYQSSQRLTKDEARKYLQYLRSGHPFKRHTQLKREKLL